MTLTNDEAREAANRLWRATFPTDRAPPSDNPLLATVRELAARLPEEYMQEDRQTCLHVFMQWMGDDR